MLAVALAVTACQAGFSIYFTTLDDLVINRAAEATGRFNRQLRPTVPPFGGRRGDPPLDRGDRRLTRQISRG